MYHDPSLLTYKTRFWWEFSPTKEWGSSYMWEFRVSYFIMRGIPSPRSNLGCRLSYTWGCLICEYLRYKGKIHQKRWRSLYKKMVDKEIKNKKINLLFLLHFVSSWSSLLVPCRRGIQLAPDGHSSHITHYHWKES